MPDKPLKRLCTRLTEKPLPLWQQLLFYLVLEVLLYASLRCVDTLLGRAFSSRDALGVLWRTDGVSLFNALLTGLLGMLLYLLIFSVHRRITFVAQVQRRWTLLPIALYILSVSLLIGCVPTLLRTAAFRLPAGDPFLYEALRMALLMLAELAFIRVIYLIRRRDPRRGRVIALLAMQALLLAGVLLLGQCVALSQTARLISAMEQSENGFLLDTLALRDELQAQVDQVSVLVYWVMRIPLFFAMRRWLFPREEVPKEATA